MQGVLSPKDARSAVDAGVDGIVLSNHGGRQLDHSPAPLDMVASVRRAIGHRVPLLMDGGIRRGTDVLKVSTLLMVSDHILPQVLCMAVMHLCTCVASHADNSSVAYSKFMKSGLLLVGLSCYQNCIEGSMLLPMLSS